MWNEGRRASGAQSQIRSHVVELGTADLPRAPLPSAPNARRMSAAALQSFHEGWATRRSSGATGLRASISDPAALGSGRKASDPRLARGPSRSEPARRITSPPAPRSPAPLARRPPSRSFPSGQPKASMGRARESRLSLHEYVVGSVHHHLSHARDRPFSCLGRQRPRQKAYSPDRAGSSSTAPRSDTGMWPRTTAPAPGELRTIRLPPTASRRSAIPCRPVP